MAIFFAFWLYAGLNTRLGDITNPWIAIPLMWGTPLVAYALCLAVWPKPALDR
jgi:hypothetical protein